MVKATNNVVPTVHMAAVMEDTVAGTVVVTVAVMEAEMVEMAAMAAMVAMADTVAAMAETLVMVDTVTTMADMEEDMVVMADVVDLAVPIKHVGIQLILREYIAMS